MAAGLLLAGCGSNAVLDPAPLGSFYDLRVENDSDATVTIRPCWGSRCQHPDGIKDTLKPGAHRNEALWGNATPGLAAMQISRDGTTVGCLRLRYRKEQTHGQARVSEASPC